MAGQIFGRIHNQNCCCGVCPGCCFPVDEYGEPVNIPFAIDAPGCSCDGVTGEFVPLAIQGSGASCGVCGSYGYDTAIEVTGQFWNPDGMGGCDLTPVCIITICMVLHCDIEYGIADDAGNAECCRRMRLEVGVPYLFTGENEPSTDPACVGGDTVFRGYVGPDSCSCVDVLSAIFSLAKFEPIVQTNPDCGDVQPCVPDCAFSGIRVII